MLGNDEKEIAATLRKLHERGIAFTVDVLGEAVVSEAEADQYAQRYLALMDFLAPEVAGWPHPRQSNESPRGHLPPLNVSVKLSALYSQIHPADPDTAIEKISARLRPILRRAAELGAFINLDMESYALKDLTLRLFKTIFAEPEFASQPACGLALQAYLKDCEADLARHHRLGAGAQSPPDGSARQRRVLGLRNRDRAAAALARPGLRQQGGDGCELREAFAHAAGE